MKLSEKGLIQPPPTLPGLLGLVAAEVESWPNIISATHWDLYRPNVPDGADYYFGETEIGHIHFYGEAHIASDESIFRIFTEQNKAEAFRFRSSSAYKHWTQVNINTHSKVQHAIELFRCNYERILAMKKDEAKQ